MEDKAFKKIMVQSKMETSEGFTDDLMKKLASRKAERPALIQIALRPAIWGLVVIGLAVLAILFLVPTNSFAILNTVHIGKMPLVVGLIFLFLAGINHILRLTYNVESYNQFAK
ncbi:MAG: hypothetical protein DSY83_02785 [Flavobacteriia bacterium]|uniref:DUF5056 domain-containing protein n=1 Tax=Flagellimonas abyssi TaxID=2864871 RepID=A0ABS7EU97_9FLAO|nr:hypothetical protein [Allomuricauda abyssi]MBW8201193.1 hypothetical protein [Allomuricauda abyssi]RUA18224.1 MAG: hypothetical protein DSY83_02785 [Flavobacteriia bacterium]